MLLLSLSFYSERNSRVLACHRKAQVSAIDAAQETPWLRYINARKPPWDWARLGKKAVISGCVQSGTERMTALKKQKLVPAKNVTAESELAWPAVRGHMNS